MVALILVFKYEFVANLIQEIYVYLLLHRIYTVYKATRYIHTTALYTHYTQAHRHMYIMMLCDILMTIFLYMYKTAFLFRHNIT